MKICGPANGLNGTTTLPGDKSISHRALMHAALSPGTSQIRNILRAGVTDAMTHCLQQLGVLFKDEEDMLVNIKNIDIKKNFIEKAFNLKKVYYVMNKK